MKNKKKIIAIICAVTVVLGVIMGLFLYSNSLKYIQAVTINTEEMGKPVENTDIVLPNLTNRADEKIEMKYKYRENPFVLMALELSIGTKMISVGGMDAMKISEGKTGKSYNE